MADSSCPAFPFFSIATSADANPIYFYGAALFVAVATICVAAHLESMFRLAYVFRIFVWEALLVSIPDIVLDDLPASVTEDDGVKSPAPADKKPLPIVDRNKPGMIQCYDPSTQQWLGDVPAMTEKEVNEVCRKSAEAQKEWKKTTFAERRTVLRTIQKYMVHHVDEICRVSARDSGKPVVDAALGEVLTTAEKIRTIVASGELWLEPDRRAVGPMFMHKRAQVEYVPLGVIGTIAPWNYPFHNYMNHIISGIYAGNGVVGKVSEYTSWSAVVYYGRIVKEALKVNGHSPDLLGTITGFGDAGAALVSSPYVDKIIFTGSPAIGKKVMETASKTLTPVILELGGKDAFVVMEDTKLDDVLPWVMRGCFQNCGQNCVGSERIIVYESIYDEFLQQVVSRVEKLRQGVPVATCGASADIDCASLVMPAQLDHIQELVDDAVARGARLMCGGKKGDSQFYQPTVLADVNCNMRIFQEEVFGPVMTIIKVAKDSDAECVSLVNNSQFGLGSSVYGGNQSRALAIGRQFRTGMLCINDFGSNYLVQSLPFGGVKDSGFGRFAGIEGLRALCLERSVLTDRIPGVKTAIPPPIDYPIQKEKGLPFAKSLIDLFYNESITAKVLAIVGLIKYGQ